MLVRDPVGVGIRCLRASGGVSRGLSDAPSTAAGYLQRFSAGRMHPVRPVQHVAEIVKRMQDPDPTGADRPVLVEEMSLYVCVTCRAEGETEPPLAARAGLRLHDALVAELGPRSGISVVPVECLSVCRRPCTVSFAARDKWTYVYGDLPAEGAAPVVAAAARLYAASPDGLVPWKLRSDPIKKGVVARVPPLSPPMRGELA